MCTAIQVHAMGFEYMHCGSRQAHGWLSSCWGAVVLGSGWGAAVFGNGWRAVVLGSGCTPAA